MRMISNPQAAPREPALTLRAAARSAWAAGSLDLPL